MDSNIKDIRRRIKILEGALGINLDTSSECSGDPLNCDTDPCDETSCPMRNNIAQQAYRGLDEIFAFIREMRYLVMRLVEKGIIRQNDLEMISLKARQEEQRDELRMLERASVELDGKMVLGQELQARMKKTRTLLAVMAKRIDELENSSHDAADPN